MPPDSKSPKGPKKGTKQHRPTAKEAALKYSDSEEEGGSSSSSNSSSKSKNRQPVKPRQKSSSTKGSGSNPSAVVKHPKSRPNLILSKKTKSLMKQQQQAQAHKAQQKGGRNSPELKKTSPKSKAPKSKSRSGKVSGGGSSGGGGGGSRSSSGLSCSKSVGPKGTTTSKSPGGHSKQQLHQAKTSVETVGSVQKTGGGGGGGGNTIIFLGSPSDPAALELLKNLVKQINPSTSEAKQQQPPQQPTSASTTTTKTTTQTGSLEDQTVVTDQTQLEEVYDAMYDLANNVKTIHDSYEKIVASLVNLQHRRSKTKKEGKGTVEKGGTLIPAATKSATSASSDGSEDAPSPPPPPPPPTPTTFTDPTDISRFMDARTRADAFAELFATVETLKEAMTPFNGCFNEGGFFQAATYAAETGRQITVGQRAAWLVQIRALNVTVEKLLAEYNREVLDMFRLVSSSGG